MEDYSRNLAGGSGGDDDINNMGEWDFSLKHITDSDRTNQETLALFIVIIIIAVITLHHFFEHLEHLAHDTAFMRLLPAIQKELMIIGTVAFALRIITILSIDQLILADENHYALLFAEILVPFITFGNVFEGCCLVLFANRWINLWIKALHSRTAEVLNEFFFYSSHSKLHRLVPNVFNEVIGKLEIRIFNNIFCEMFGLKRSAFPFDQYLQTVYEKFVQDIVLVGVYDWIVLILLLTLEYIRTSYIHWVLYTCHSSEEEERRRRRRGEGGGGGGGEEKEEEEEWKCKAGQFGVALSRFTHPHPSFPSIIYSLYICIIRVFVFCIIVTCFIRVLQYILLD